MKCKEEIEGSDTITMHLLVITFVKCNYSISRVPPSQVSPHLGARLLLGPDRPRPAGRHRRHRHRRQEHRQHRLPGALLPPGPGGRGKRNHCPIGALIIPPSTV